MPIEGRSTTLSRQSLGQRVILPTKGGQSDQALVDSSKASGAT